MASITRRSNGSQFITFHTNEGTRRHITLGKVSRRSVESIKVRVEDLASAAIHGHPPTDATSRWLADLDGRIYAKLAKVGLVPTRVRTTIATLADGYIALREGDLKPESVRKLRQTESKLLAFFDADTPLRSITPDDAAAWRRSLKDLHLSEAAIRTHCGNAKTMLADSLRRKIISDNPFSMLSSGPTPSHCTRYVTPEEIERVIEACPDTEWSLLFGLARYAGLRIPSESRPLTWADADLERGRLTVHSPKTERWAGHERRIMPISPRLMALLLDRLEISPERSSHLVTIANNGAVIRRVRKIWAIAGVEPWPRLWQTLRSSCEKQWAMTYPQYAVSKWIGHSITVSGRHYVTAVPDELFDRAAGLDAPGTPNDSAQRNAQQKAHATPGNA